MLGIGLSLTGRLKSSASIPPSFSPSTLFALAEPGVWYDPSDLTTLFQDTAGTTPVTTPGQTVALALDKSKGLVLGPELRGNGVVATIGSPGTLGNYDTSTGAGSAYRLDGSNVSGVQIPVADGRTYLLDVEQLTGTLQIRGNGLAGNQLVTNVVGRKTYRLFTASGEDLFFVTGANAASVTFFVHSVRELPGFHATQATAASRPTYGVVPLGGRRNLLTYSEQFDNAAWSKVSGSVLATTDPQQWYFANDGVNATSILSSVINPSGDAIFAIDIKADTLRYVRLRYGNVTNPTPVNIDAQTGTTDGLASTNVGDGFFRFYLPFTSGADNNGIIQITLSDTYGGTSVTPSASKRVIIRRPQFELGSTATNYQRVGSAFDVTEAGVPSLHYLSFDGVDDFLVTPTITPGIDKAQVFAGVRKLSDAAVGLLVELSSSLSSFNGSMFLAAPGGAGSGRIDWSSKGTVKADAQAFGLATPVTVVATGIGDIAGDVSTLRINGALAQATTTDQGTGNYLAYPLYIGRRGGTILPFNGHLYGLVVRFGANLDQVDINRAERWVADKTGVTL